MILRLTKPVVNQLPAFLLTKTVFIGKKPDLEATGPANLAMVLYLCIRVFFWVIVMTTFL
jgi:hypothetical protein